VLPREIEELFEKHVPEDFQKDTVRLMVDTYRRSREDVRARYQFPEDKYMWGHERRAMFDRDWRTLAGKFGSDGITATIEPNKSENFHFTRINAGRIIITAALVDDRYEMVRRAEYRATYARSCFRSLFGDDAPSETAPLYAILIHAPRTCEGLAFPKFIDLVFPEPEQKIYAHRIRLLERGFVDVPSGVEEEAIPDTLHPKLNKGESQKGAESA
jgi:hypothetical protein